MARKPKKPKKQKPPKPPKLTFRERMTERGRTAAGLSRTLVNEPKSFPGQVLKLAKRSFRALWNARGGGLYACGFVVTFVWLEVTTLVGEVVNAQGVGSFVTDQLIQIVFRFTLQSLENTVSAFIWPVWVLQRFEGWGFAILAALYFIFPRYIKEPLAHWLMDDEPLAVARSAVDAAPAMSGEVPDVQVTADAEPATTYVDEAASPTKGQ